MTIDEAIDRMKAKPGLKMCMPNHYHDNEYNYYDAKKKMFLTETGEEWHIDWSLSYNELDGYEDYIKKLLLLQYLLMK
jgi:hypothetical protein